MTVPELTDEERQQEIARIEEGFAARAAELIPHGAYECCPKCGAPDAHVSRDWHESGLPPYSAPGIFAPVNTAPCTRGWLDFPFGEHLCRRCRQCGYGWVEATASGD